MKCEDCGKQATHSERPWDRRYKPKFCRDCYEAFLAWQSRDERMPLSARPVEFWMEHSGVNAKF
jgi:hypothetical protein